MPKPYSYDLREKVIQAIEFDGFKTSVASLLFNISRNTMMSLGWITALFVA